MTGATVRFGFTVPVTDDPREQADALRPAVESLTRLVSNQGVGPAELTWYTTEPTDPWTTYAAPVRRQVVEYRRETP